MARRTASIAAIGAALALLSWPPSGTPDLVRRPLVVSEAGSVAFGGGVEVRLGDPVAALEPSFSREAYDAKTGRGLVQWRAPSGNAVLLLAESGAVRAFSVAFAAGFRTAAGVELGDPAGRVRRVYGGAVRDGGGLAERYALAEGFVIGEEGGTVTYFDTSCTGVVNAIGLASGAAGLRALGGLWAPGPDPCGGPD